MAELFIEREKALKEKAFPFVEKEKKIKLLKEEPRIPEYEKPLSEISQTEKIKPQEAKHFWREVAADLVFGLASLAIPGGVLTLPLRATRIPKYISVVKDTLSFLDGTKAGKVLKVIADEVKINTKMAAGVVAGRSILGDALELQKRDPVEFWYSTVVGGLGIRGAIEGIKAGIKATKPILSTAIKMSRKSQKMDSFLEKASDTIIKKATGFSPGTIKTITSLGSYGTGTISHLYYEYLDDIFNSPEVRKDYGKFINSMITKLAGEIPGIPDEVLIEIRRRALTEDWYNSYFWTAFKEAVDINPEISPTLASKIKELENLPELKAIKDEAKQAFVENKMISIKNFLVNLAKTINFRPVRIRVAEGHPLKPLIETIGPEKANIETVLNDVDFAKIRTALIRLEERLAPIKKATAEELEPYYTELRKILNHIWEKQEVLPITFIKKTENWFTGSLEKFKSNIKKLQKKIDELENLKSYLNNPFDKKVAKKKLTEELQDVKNAFRLIFNAQLKEEIKLLEKTKKFLSILLSEETPKTVRISTLNYLFKDLIKEQPVGKILSDFGINETILAQLSKKLVKIQAKVFVEPAKGLKELTEIIIQHAKNVKPIESKMRAILMGQTDDFLRYYNNYERPIVERFFEMWIPREGIKHYFKKIARDEHNLIEIIDQDFVRFLDEAPEWFAAYGLTALLKPRTIPTLSNAFIFGVRELWFKENLIKKPVEEAVDFIFNNFRLSGGVGLPNLLAAKLFIPKFLNDLYKKFDDFLKNPKILKDLDDFRVQKSSFSLFHKKWDKVPVELLEALTIYKAHELGAYYWLMKSGFNVSLNVGLKRLFLWWAITFHGAVLTLSAIALNLPLRDKIRVVIRSLIDAFRVPFVGHNHQEMTHMLREIARAQHAVRQAGYEVVDLNLSGYFEGRRTFAEFITLGKSVLGSFLKRGDPSSVNRTLELSKTLHDELKKEAKLTGKESLKRLFRWFFIGLPDGALWDGLYRGLKIRTAYSAIKLWRQGVLDEATLANTFKSINDVFGGWHGWRLIHPNHASLYRLLFFAPDWYISIFNNFRTWVSQTSPLVSKFYPAILRMRWWIANSLNYAVYGTSPIDKYDFSDGKQIIKFLLHDWTNLFKVYIPIIDKAGRKRFLIIDLLGPEKESLEMIGLLGALHSFIRAIEHPTMDLSSRVWDFLAGTGKEFYHYWVRKSSSILRIFGELYRSTRWADPAERITFEEAMQSIGRQFAPLIFQQFLQTRYPYRVSEDFRDVFEHVGKLQAFSAKIYVKEDLIDYMFENRHLEKARQYFDRYLDEFEKAVEDYRRYFGKEPKITFEQSLTRSLGERYLKEYFEVWVKDNKDKDLKNLLSNAHYIVNKKMVEDIKESVFPYYIKSSLINYVKKNYADYVKKVYKKEKFVEALEE